MSDLESVHSLLRAFVAERQWAQFHDPKNLAMAIASEAGELLAEYRWVEGAGSDEWSAEEANRARVATEAADIGIALVMFCDRIGVNLVEAMLSKIAVNRQNYPVNLSKGRPERPADPKR